ncbi:MAG: helix-turn-helix domain-containing protein [Planctomycetes bacterium]|nr:helix-turn-helix domain-containing protein [Planctomycetota bacterium]
MDAPLVALPAGIPSYGGSHGREAWRADAPPVRRRCADWLFHWVCHGEAHWELKDGRRLTVGADGFAIIPPLVAATLSQAQPGLVLWSCQVSFRAHALAPPSGLRGDVIAPGEQVLVPMTFTAEEAPPVLDAYRALSLLAPTEQGALWRLERAVLQLMGEVAAFARVRTRSRAPGRVLGAALREDERLVTILRRIDADPAHPWCVEDIAHSLSISTQRLHVLCRATQGTGLKAYIVRARLELALRLLRKRDDGPALSMREISERCGFASQHFFSRQFRSFFGVTPSDHRAGGALGERERDDSDWGEPTVVLPARDDVAHAPWVTHLGGFRHTDDGVVSTAMSGDLLVCDRRLDGDCAIEFEGILPTEVPSSDLSVFWIRTDDWRYAGRSLELSPEVYRLQVGASGAYSAIMTGARTHLAYDDFRPLPGRTYRIRAEVRGNRLTLSVDGRIRCEHRGLFPLVGGHVGLYAFFPGVAFRDIRIFARQPPALVPATAVADHYLDQREYAPAAEQYARVATAHAGTRLAQKARYRQGLSLRLAGRDDEADQVWNRIAGTAWDEPVRLHGLARSFAAARHDEVLSRMEDLYGRSRPDTRAQIAISWAGYASALTDAALRDGVLVVLERYIDLRERVFPERTTADNAAAEAMLALGRFADLLERYPRQRNACARALMYLGREDEVLAQFPDQPIACIEALRRVGRSSEIAARFPWFERGMALPGAIMRGAIEQLLQAYPGHGQSLIALGRAHEVLADPGAGAINRMHAAIMLGRESELEPDAARDVHVLMARGAWRAAFAAHAGDFWYGMWPRHALALEAAISGDAHGLREWSHVRPDQELHQEHFHLMHYLIVPFLREVLGEVGATCAACELVVCTRRWAYGQLPWHNASRVLGAIDDARHLAQPHGAFAASDLLLCHGIAYELASDTSAAASAYRSYLELPRHRRGTAYDPLPERFAHWRIERLAGHGGSASGPRTANR